MNKKIVLLPIHIPVWIIAALVAYFFSFDDVPPGNPMYVEFSTLVFTIWFLASFYGFYSYLIPNYLEKGKIKAFGFYSVLFVLVIIPVFVLLLSRLTKVSAFELLSGAFIEEVFWPYLGAVFGALFCGILGALYRFSIDWFNNLHIRNEIENIKLKSDLKAIKSRLNPHFLFNTLNNIDTLILQANPEKASIAIAKLSDLLRYVVYETENEKITVQKELDTVKKYIDLEQLRISNPDSVSYDNSVTQEFLIPPMIFMPFIENAFKHSNLNQPNRKIAVSFSENKDELVFHCVNTTGVQKKESGVGLELVRKRLELMYPGKYSLKIEQHNNEYSVLLKITVTDD